jgi:DNA-binding transcriptional LysR family regulator
MARPIPPLNPLRSFEAAARHNSFARAAQELSVTPAAISRQVKLLEDYFGVEFFRREPSGISLTPEAMDYAKGLGKAFRQIASLTDEFRTRHTSSILTIRGYTTFLVKWLVPRLPDFQAAHPHIKVRLSGGSSAPAAGSGGQADIVIRYGGPHWPGHRALLLFRASPRAPRPPTPRPSPDGPCCRWRRAGRTGTTGSRRPAFPCRSSACSRSRTWPWCWSSRAGG